MNFAVESDSEMDSDHTDEHDFGAPFYSDDDEEVEHNTDYQSSIVEASSGLMDLVSDFLQQPNLNSTIINTWTGRTYFMHAIAAKRMDIVHKFIEYEIELNISDKKNWTPLHYAVSSNNIECVCLLLSYGVDVRIKSEDQETPLTVAFALGHEEIIKYLLLYYYEFANINLTNIKFDNKWFQTKLEDIILLIIAMDNSYFEPFKIIWGRIDLDAIIYYIPNDHFLQKCLCKSIYLPASKLDRLYSVEITDIACMFDNVEFFLHKAFLSRKFDQTRRMDLLFMLLSTGANIDFENINQLYQVCGFNKELEALIYAANQKWNKYEWSSNNALLYSILSFTINTNTYYDFCQQLKYMNIFYPNHLIPWLKYFSLFSDLKYIFASSFTRRQGKELLKSLRKVSEFPSLLELARLAAQNLIKQTCNITKPYQFHDSVKQLCLPELLKDILLFKRPIYK